MFEDAQHGYGLTINRYDMSIPDIEVDSPSIPSPRSNRIRTINLKPDGNVVVVDDHIAPCSSTVSTKQDETRIPDDSSSIINRMYKAHFSGTANSLTTRE